MRIAATPDDWFISSPAARFDRLEAFFGGHAYTPHRHDTYAIGLTLTGVQSFSYRGAHRSSLPGHVIVIHPDERHDGHAGNVDGFRYRMLYVQPALIQHMLCDHLLPFVPGGIVCDPTLAAATARLLRDLTSPLEDFEEQDALFDLTQALSPYSGRRPGRARIPDRDAAHRAKAYLDSALCQTVTLDELAVVSGQDRWRLSRDFRTLYGTRAC